eukprot:TRINITY_DN7182_c0_g1_i1.p1 TRINITY_DN7182_c0_g1~~TRINITY_DN7182_c0_g1_i1.p1  ORF type:complete len:301 (+),score=88.51 TRINITY_DN7182_c0_g1_i1:40-903(+)
MTDGIDAVLGRLVGDLLKTKYVLLATGAGWSAESGLPTYRGSAFYKKKEFGGEELSYAEVCRPCWARGEDRERVFKPFWAGCAEVYGSATPHGGYQVFQKLFRDKDYYVYTSNVDGHFLKTGFPRERVAEIHGNILEWQCIGGSDCPLFTPAVPVHESFPDECPKCSASTRPHIVMFGDDECTHTPHMGPDYQAWENGVEAALQEDPSQSLVIVEVGCGRTVPAVRMETEEVLRDITAAGGSAVLYRVNATPDDCQADDASLSSHVFPVPCPLGVVVEKIREALGED